MKSSLIAAVGVFALALVGCGSSQARVYSIAYDSSPDQNLPPSCFDNNTVPTKKTEYSNERKQLQFVVWDGAEGKQFLDISDKVWNLGDADPVIIDGLIESPDGKVFVGSRTARNLPPPGSNSSDIQVSTVTVTFEEIGNTARGSLVVKSEYSCTGCPNNTRVATCSAQYTFSGRRAEYSNIAVTPNQF